MAHSKFPNARSENLVIQEVADETLVYDLTKNEAHCLNQTAAFVWSKCNGDKSIDEIAKTAEIRFGHPMDAEVVRLAIKQLDERHLLKESGMFGLPNPSRRELIKKVGLASAIAIPIVTSLVAPMAVSAASCACMTTFDCNPQLSCPSQTNCNPSNVCAP